MTKPHLSYSDQVNLLISRGLIISNPRAAEQFLENVNYYHLRGYYIDCFDNKINRFHSGVTWEDIVEKFNADRYLRGIYFHYLEEVELRMRTTISYYLSDNYGSHGYRDATYFRNENRHKKFIDAFNKEVERSSENFVKHFAKEQNNPIPQMPIWAAIEALTFGTISKRLFYMLKAKDQKKIAQCFDLKSEKVLTSYLRCLTLLRNRCAHHSRLYNRILTDGCSIYNSHAKIIKNICPDFKCDAHSLFAYTLALIHLLPQQSKTCFLDELKSFATKYPKYHLEKCGFPPNWMNVLNQII